MINVMYNINDYLTDIVNALEEISMTIDGVLSSIKGGNSVVLLEATHKSLSLIREEPFYVGTSFVQISSNLNPRFVLVSAPGATGKSAFGKYLAYKRNALYWNLANLSIGDGTFQGTLYKALGASKISEYAQSLQKGESTLVIDAFDEAEIISGRKNVETFLHEANDFLESSSSLSIVLLSRTETAQNIATLFRSNAIPYVHYEIGYFQETNAKDFIIKTAEKRKKKLTPAVYECVNQYFSQVQALITDKETLKKFLGYAPVLEAISAHIIEIPNTAKLLSDLKESSDEVTLIKNVMENLLSREHDKFISAFQERIKSDSAKIEDWSVIYNQNEQLIRILNYILFGEIAKTDLTNTAVPLFLEDEYLEMLRMFLPQHPFIQNTFVEKGNSASTDFAGPAFRDYCLAYTMLIKDYEASAELYYQREATTSHFPSPLFWNHYIDMNGNSINSRHFLYVYEAFKSKISVGCQTYLDISQDSFETCATFRITKGKETIDSTTLEVNVDDNSFVFESINNTSISVEGTVIIGQNDNVFITDSSVFCKKLVLNAKNITINAFAPNATTIISELPVESSKAIPTNFIISATGIIQIDFPNIFEFPKLSRYKYTSPADGVLDIYTFVHCLRKIFSSFRTHKKDMPARDAEKIDYVVIAGNPLKKSIFDFLMNASVIFREAHLYKINLDEMSKRGISWGALISTDTAQLQTVFDEFCNWKSNAK